MSDFEETVKGFLKENHEAYLHTVARCRRLKRLRFWMTGVVFSFYAMAIVLNGLRFQFGWVAFDVGMTLFFLPFNWYNLTKALDNSRSLKKQLAQHQQWLRGKLVEYRGWKGDE